MTANTHIIDCESDFVLSTPHRSSYSIPTMSLLDGNYSVMPWRHKRLRNSLGDTASIPGPCPLYGTALLLLYMFMLAPSKQMT